MSKIRNSVRHPRFVMHDNTIADSDLFNAIEKAIKKRDSVELEGLFEYAQLHDLMEKVTEWFHFDILYDLMDTQDLQLIKIALDRVGYNVINIINEDNGTPLMWAALEGRLDCVKFLIENGADVNLETSDGDFALYSSVENLDTDNSNIKVFEYLYPLTSEDLQKDILEYLREHQVLDDYHLEIDLLYPTY
jgi:Ankyrin repeats (3 copies)